MQLSFLDRSPSAVTGSATQISQVKQIFENVFFELKARSFKFINVRSVHVEFYPYVSLKHTLRLNGKEATIRLSALAQGEDETFFVALANILWAKIFGMKAKESYRNLYRQREKEIAKACPPSSRKIFLPPQGVNHDLKNILNCLNEKYFQSNFDLAIGWSKRLSVVRLGHYDHSSRLIVLSRILDHVDVPDFVVESVVYHEMLHHQFPVENQNGRTVIHSSAFKKADRAFEYYGCSRTWLKHDYPKLIRKLK
jgi:hypothetical protein